MTASAAERFEFFKTLLRPKSLKNQAFWRRVIVTRELRFAAACGRRRRCAISAAAPFVGRHEAGPQTAVRQGEQGALPARAPPRLYCRQLKHSFLTVSRIGVNFHTNPSTCRYRGLHLPNLSHGRGNSRSAPQPEPHCGGGRRCSRWRRSAKAYPPQSTSAAGSRACPLSFP